MIDTLANLNIWLSESQKPEALKSTIQEGVLFLISSDAYVAQNRWQARKDLKEMTGLELVIFLDKESFNYRLFNSNLEWPRYRRTKLV